MSRSPRSPNSDKARPGAQYEPLGIGCGTRIAGRYEIDRKIGSGGMSAVFLARDKELNNQSCAIKILEPSAMNSDTDFERFKNEVVITRTLTHANIVRTFEFGRTEAGQYFITMEHVEGKSLYEMIYHSKEAFGFRYSIGLIIQIAHAIKYAHDAGVVHRDLKPGNILISPEKGVKITDFGLAQARQLELHVTKAGECVGTPAYMAPEQVAGEEVDHRADLYALGVLTYELIARELPFREQNWVALAQRILKDPLPRLSEKNPKMPEWVDRFIQRATDKRKELRFQSAEEAAKFLEEHLGDTEDLGLTMPRTSVLPTSERIEALSTVAAKTFGRNSGLLAAGSAIALVFLVILGLTHDSAQSAAVVIDGQKAPIAEFTNTLQGLTTAIMKFHDNRDKVQDFTDRIDNLNRSVSELEERAKSATAEQANGEGAASIEKGREEKEKEKETETDQELDSVGNEIPDIDAPIAKSTNPENNHAGKSPSFE